MIQAYVDETGNDGESPIFLFSALIGEAEKLATLSNEWSKALREIPRIVYFKMDEAESCDGQFYGFSPKERDDKVKRLCAIMSSSDLTEFGFGIKQEVFNSTFAIKAAGRPLTERYFFPFHATIIGTAEEVLRQGATEPFEIFFDEQVIFGPRAKAWYPIIRAMALDQPIYPILPVEPFFRKDTEALPLQAADLTAWVRRKVNTDGLGEFEWLRRELSGVKLSPLSATLSKKSAEFMFTKNEETPEMVRLRELALQAYRETFGHEWPAKTKLERKIISGRAKKRK